ncbi:hypothetical protein K469DRAFT_639854 [Zopfia rhizophila CBS 207.26]|uniref:Carbohydrate-binding module family 18 protein n=1 Tax=Zopfia rhizophila CBS 207.26 TaxID=1314779 RepID=A0A6A6DQA1_9PEZI|nr:hypothetical protein K469DRAFT_639854 [Zopfia rhizophila CBS 207.26]
MAIRRLLHSLILTYLSVFALGEGVEPRLAGKPAGVGRGYSIDERSLFGRQILGDGCPYGYNPCGDRCMPIGGECCNNDGRYCPFGSYCTVIAGSNCCCETGEVCDYCPGDEIPSSYVPLPESTPAPSTIESLTSYAPSTVTYYSWTYYDFTITWYFTLRSSYNMLEHY